jgi:hypothetical protein
MLLHVAHVPSGGNTKSAVDAASPELVFEGAKARVLVRFKLLPAIAKVFLAISKPSASELA